MGTNIWESDDFVSEKHPDPTEFPRFSFVPKWSAANFFVGILDRHNLGIESQIFPYVPYQKRWESKEKP